MLADRLLSHLTKVRQTGQDRWVACCPAHEDKSPSLAIREIDDRLLLHCFAGCAIHEIVEAIGMDISELFLERPVRQKPVSRPFPATDVLKCLSNEISFLIICAGDISKGKNLNNEDFDRLLIVKQRFNSALQAAGIS